MRALTFEEVNYLTDLKAHCPGLLIDYTHYIVRNRGTREQILAGRGDVLVLLKAPAEVTSTKLVRGRQWTCSIEFEEGFALEAGEYKFELVGVDGGVSFKHRRP